ncbi:MAG: hypothetical protein IT379_04805 [Deltaproteobacteria bacterium]|nr:hypothetical protein [Deltaproteobacteria bacterium]
MTSTEPCTTHRAAPRSEPPTSRVPALALLLTAAVTLLVGSCGASRNAPATTGVAHTVGAPVTGLAGRVTYDARRLTKQGLTATTERRPARFVVVQLKDGRGRVIGRSYTDGEGRYAFPRVPRRAVQIEVLASIRPFVCRAPPCPPSVTLDVTSDGGGQRPHLLASSLRSLPAGAPLDLHASVDPPHSTAGAFHILDTLFRGSVAVHDWTGRTLPPLFAIWQYEGPSDWSYYRGERGRGRFAIELMGGERGRSATTDSDQHDEMIILHELGHFVFDMLSTDSSIGGSHPAHVLTDPGVAWEEGRATWFACAVLGEPIYQDAIGIAPQGRLRLDDDIETFTPNALRGLGSQQTASELLWDLSDGTLPDGTTPIADRDSDGVALGPAAVLRAMMAQREVPGAYPSSLSFLRFLVSSNALSADAARALLVRPSDHRLALPADGEADAWPRDVAFATDVDGKVDGISNPAPSGGAAHPVNGFDATAAYRVHVTARGRLTAQLRINGSGTAADRTDLELELRNARADAIDRSIGTTPIETISRVVDPGFYVVYVRDAGNGNRANFRLRVELQPAP